MRRNPYHGLPGDPYGGEQFIPDGASVLNGHVVGASGTRLPQYPGSPVAPVEPRSFRSWSSAPAAQPSMSMPTTTVVTAPDHPLTNASAQHHDHHVRDSMLVGAAVGGAAAYAASVYIGNDKARYWRTMWIVTVAYFVVLILPFILLAMSLHAPGLLFFATPFLLILGYAWATVPGHVRRTWPHEPTDAERQAAYEARMARLIPEYDRLVAEYQRRHGVRPRGMLNP